MSESIRRAERHPGQAPEQNIGTPERNARNACLRCSRTVPGMSWSLFRVPSRVPVSLEMMLSEKPLKLFPNLITILSKIFRVAVLPCPF